MQTNSNFKKIEKPARYSFQEAQERITKGKKNKPQRGKQRIDWEE